MQKTIVLGHSKNDFYLLVYAGTSTNLYFAQPIAHFAVKSELCQPEGAQRTQRVYY